MDRFRRMEIFVAIVEAGQFTRAAEALHLSKSAVSHGLSDLEKYLGLQLLSRNNRSLQVTAAGQNYYEHCKRILADIENIEDQVRSEDHRVSGYIRVSAPDTFGSYTLTPIIAQFMDEHPDIIVEMNLTERFVDLLEERVDIAFRTGGNSANNLIGEVIGEAKMLLCASPDYIKKYGAPQSHKDLKNHLCLKYTRSPIWRLSKNGRKYEFTPTDYILTDSGETVREFCIRGSGIGYMPSILAEHALKRGRLTQILTQYDQGTMPVTAVRLKGNRAPARVLRLYEFVVQELRGRKKDIAEFV